MHVAGCAAQGVFAAARAAAPAVVFIDELDALAPARGGGAADGAGGVGAGAAAHTRCAMWPSQENVTGACTIRPYFAQNE